MFYQSFCISFYSCLKFNSDARIILLQAYVNFQEAIKSEEGLGVEYDEDAICDVCRSVSSLSVFLEYKILTYELFLQLFDACIIRTGLN